jgi:hypothetical protein
MLNKQIAAELGTSERTVKAHRARVMAKMSAPSVIDLARMAQLLESSNQHVGQSSRDCTVAGGRVVCEWLLRLDSNQQSPG